MSRRRRMGAAALGLGLLLGLAASPGSAQSYEDLVGRCVLQGGASLECLRASEAARGVSALVGLALAGGGGGASPQSTLGRRLPGGTPRLGLDVQGFGTGFELPNPGSSATVDGTALAFRGALTVGAFEGFQPLPTVGGVLSLDLFATLGLVRLSASDGFDGSVGGGGFGARLGLLRESFTVPGLSLSWARSWSGEIGLEDAAGSPGRVQSDGATTSLRAAVGKYLFGLGLHAGFGRDVTTSDVSLSVGPGAGAALLGSDSEVTRWLFFGGATLNYLVLQVTGEAGWAGNFGALPGSAANVAVPDGSAAPFASLGARLIF